MNPQEIIIYRSPQEKLMADYVMAHPWLMWLGFIVGSIFALVIFGSVLSIFLKVRKDFKDFDKGFDRWNKRF